MPHPALDASGWGTSSRILQKVLITRLIPAIINIFAKFIFIQTTDGTDYKIFLLDTGRD
jgi:hypothetical protein